MARKKDKDVDVISDVPVGKKPSFLASLGAYRPPPKMLLTALVALVVMVTAALLTVGLLIVLQREPAPEPAKHSDLEALQVRTEDLESRIRVYEASFEIYRKSLEISDPAVFQQVLLKQEESYQLHLKTLKQGMVELSDLLPDSQGWMEDYGGQMDEAIRQSQARVAELRAIQLADPE